MLSMRKLDAEIDDIKFEPKNAIEFRNAKKKKKTDKTRSRE